MLASSQVYVPLASGPFLGFDNSFAPEQQLRCRVCYVRPTPGLLDRKFRRNEMGTPHIHSRNTEPKNTPRLPTNQTRALEARGDRDARVHVL